MKKQGNSGQTEGTTSPENAPFYVLHTPPSQLSHSGHILGKTLSSHKESLLFKNFIYKDS